MNDKKIDTRICSELESELIKISKAKKWSKAYTFRFALEEFVDKYGKPNDPASRLP